MRVSEEKDMEKTLVSNSGHEVNQDAINWEANTRGGSDLVMLRKMGSVLSFKCIWNAWMEMSGGELEMQICSSKEGLICR